MTPEILGLLAIPLDAEERGRYARSKRAGILYRQRDAAAPGRDARPRFLDLDTLAPEPIAEEAVAAGRLWPLDRRHAGLLATGIDKARRRLRASHAGFADALSQKIGLALRDLARTLPATPPSPRPVSAARTPVQAPARTRAAECALGRPPFSHTRRA